MQYKLYQISNRQVSTLITKLIHNILVSVLRSVTRDTWHVTAASNTGHNGPGICVHICGDFILYRECSPIFGSLDMQHSARESEMLKSVEVSWFLVSHFTLSPHSARLIGSVQCLECQSAARVTLITPPPASFIADTDSSLLSRAGKEFAQSRRRLLLGPSHG